MAWTKVGNLRGPEGPQGEPGPISTTPGPPGPPGEDGDTPTVEWDGPVLVVGGERSPNLTGPEGAASTVPGPPGAVPTAADYMVVGPGRPDAPTTTGMSSAALEALPVGAEYRSTDGASVGAWVWLKTATSWIVTMGETPLVDISPMITASGTWTMGGADRAYMYRINSLVYVSLAPMRATNTTHTKQMDWPTGFQKAAAGPAYTPLIAQASADGSPRGYANAHHEGLYLKAAAAATPVMAEVAPFRTADPWPTTLPGTPA